VRKHHLIEDAQVDQLTLTSISAAAIAAVCFSLCVLTRKTLLLFLRPWLSLEGGRVVRRAGD
jgi:hypothetical protein